MKRRQMFIGIFIFFVMIVQVFAQAEPKVELNQLSDHLYHMVVSTTYAENGLVSVGPDGILLVDPGMVGAEDKIEEVLEKLGGGEIRYVLLTHNHGHHFDALKKLKGNPVIIAHENVRKSMLSGFDLLQEWPDKTLPVITFSEPVSIYFNGEKIDMIPMIGGHSNGDVVIHFTGSNVVAIGGLLPSDAFPFIDNNYGGIFSKYPENLQKIIDEFPADAKYIPPHGRVHTMDDVKKAQEMLNKTIKIVCDEFNKGKSLQEIQQAKVLKDWDSWGQGFVTADVWIQTIVNGLTKKGPDKVTIIEPLFYKLKDGTGKEAVDLFNELKKTKADKYAINENSINVLGYYLLGKERYDDAIEIFKLNISEYPDSWNVYDSLGEAYMLKGNKKQAVKYYEKSIQINPENNNGKQKLKELEGK